MAVVHLPALLQPLAGGAATVEADGATLRAIIDDLERQHPALRERIVNTGMLRPDIMVAIDGDEARDLDAPVAPAAEVRILPAIAGG
jgi:molybdopterin converting factor small subunit